MTNNDEKNALVARCAGIQTQRATNSHFSATNSATNNLKALSDSVLRRKETQQARNQCATNDQKTAQLIAPKNTLLVAQKLRLNSPQSCAYFSPEKAAKSTALIVTCYTPAGNPIEVEAKDEEHAAWLRQMNPQPLWCLRKEKNKANG